MGKASILCFCLTVGALTYLLLGFVQIWKGTSKSGTSVQAIIINLVQPLAHTRLISSLCEIPCWKHVAQMWKQQVNGDITHIDLEESCVEILLSIVGVAFLIGLLFRSVAGVFFTAIALMAYMKTTAGSLSLKYRIVCREFIAHSRLLWDQVRRSHRLLNMSGIIHMEQLPSILFERLLNCAAVCLLSLL